MPVPLNRHLHQRYLQLTAVLALMIGLGISAAQGYRDYRQQVSSTNEKVLHLVDSAVPSAALASYTLDPYLAQRVVDGLTLRSAIFSARLVTDLGEELAESHIPKGADYSPLERVILESILGKPFTIRRPLEGALSNRTQLGLGYVEIAVAPALDGENFLGRTAMGLTAVLIQTLLLCGALTVMFFRTTARPLQQVVENLRQVELGGQGSSARLTIPAGHEDDEIGYMVRSFNAQLNSAHTQIKARKLAEASLLRANEELEERVRERTAYLDHEITERRTVEVALRHSEGRFRDLAEVSSDWFWETDNQGRITEISARFLELCGKDRSELVGRSIVDLIRWRLVKVTSPSLGALRDMFKQAPLRISCEMAIRGRGGREMRAQIGGKRLTSATGVLLGYRGTGHDITRQVEDAEKLKLATYEAERANEAKSEFLANMSHELRTPMNAILGFAQLLRLQRQNPLSKPQLQYVSHIVDAGEHLLGLINDVLDLARIEAGHLDLSIEEIDLSLLIAECIDMMRPLAEQKSVTIDFPDVESPEQSAPMRLMADRVRLKQVVINLLSNAIKYNRVEGAVQVRVGVVLHTSRCPRIQVDICDTGIGIPPSHIGRVFDPFHRVSAATQAVEGTGVGLAVTRRLLEAMNGRIDVESIVGKGSRFWFTLPACDIRQDQNLIHDQDMRFMPAPGQDQITLLNEPLSLLYVEDNPANRLLMEDLLDGEGPVTLTMAESCAEAMRLAGQAEPDLIFLDINLPDGDGAELASLLRARLGGSSVPIVAISANARAQDIDSAHEAGFDGYLCKPFAVQDVYDVIRARQAVLASEGKDRLHGSYI